MQATTAAVQSPSKAQAQSIDAAIDTALKAAVYSYYQRLFCGHRLYEWADLGVSLGWSFPISLLGSGDETIDNTGIEPVELPLNEALNNYGEKAHFIVHGIEWDYESKLYKISQSSAVVPLKVLPAQWEIDAHIPGIQSIKVTFANGVVKASTKP
jgi:hypothetical protein